jgi:hypothetical protein
MVGELNSWFHEDPQDSVENKQIMPWSVWLDFEVVLPSVFFKFSG